MPITDGPVYLASPYSHRLPEVMVSRWRVVCRIAANLMQKGIFVYSPIAHNHPCVEFGCPRTWEFWEQYDRAFLNVCSRMLIANIEGWETSTGVNAEIVIAKDIGLQVKMVNATTYQEYVFEGEQ